MGLFSMSMVVNFSSYGSGLRRLSGMGAVLAPGSMRRGGCVTGASEVGR